MRKVLVYLDDTYADWEQAFSCCQLVASNFVVETIAPKREIISLSSFVTKVNYVLTDNINIDEYEILILVGGNHWNRYQYTNEAVLGLVNAFIAENKFVAAICDATTFMAHNGLYNNIKHTGNTLNYLQKQCPNYQGQGFYLDKQAVRDGWSISANVTATLEFAKEILLALQAMKDEQTIAWYNFMKNGITKN